MNTEDYVAQCMTHLSDTNTYRLAPQYPTEKIKQELSHICAAFKSQLESLDKRLYKYLQQKTRQTRTPRFYGIPKVHKQYVRVPPVRPIVSQSASLLSPTANLIDYLLQPIARSYPDYLHNSTALSLVLQDLQVPDNASLVTIDVSSLYPSIPQTQCLDIIYKELHTHRHLLPCNPNLIIRLLHTNINNTFFTFGHLTFQQIKGTAMGAPFSPTVANIFMSIILKDFLKTQPIQPLLITRYIDDIFMIWTQPTTDLTAFLANLNKFHPSLHFTHEHSSNTIDFLDLTIYKGPFFDFTNILDTKTFQKDVNLYQYLHFSSNHPASSFKAIIKGECIRYIRTNTTFETYMATIQLFRERLLKRRYPLRLINNIIRTVHYDNRQKCLQCKQLVHHTAPPPLYKCVPPPKYKLLKQLVLQDYHILHFQSPRFVTLRHPTIQNLLVRSAQTFSDEQLIDVQLMVGPTNRNQEERAALPQLRHKPPSIVPCRHPRCMTCSMHLLCASTFKSNYPRNPTIYQIRHSFSCTSTNLVYLISCTKCKKQYIGCTTKQLNVRINHHRSCINNKKPTFIHKHFNLPDHSITNLKVQPIDTTHQTLFLMHLHQPGVPHILHQMQKTIHRVYNETIKRQNKPPQVLYK